MKKIVVITFASALVVILSSCGSKTTYSVENDTTAAEAVKGSINISGAFALYPLANVWAEEFRKEYPEVRINISGGGAGKGMADVLAGATDLAMFSREITPEEMEKGAWWISVTKDAVIPTISDKNPILDQLKNQGITRQELASFFLGEGEKKWKNSSYDVMVYTRSDAAGAADVWSKYLGGKAQEDLKGIAVYGDPGLADAVKNEPLSIGFNNVIYVYDLKTGGKYQGLEVVPIDINNNGTIDPEENFYGSIQEIMKAIADGRYPSPPARELYFVSRGKPTNTAVVVFLKWILEKGQVFVKENGYIQLSEEVIKAQKLKF